MRGIGFFLLGSSVLILGCGGSSRPDASTDAADAAADTLDVGADAVDGSVCDDDVADLVNHPAGTCSNLGPLCSGYCDVSVPRLKPGRAFAARRCQAIRCATSCVTTEECHDTNIGCMIEVLAEACEDASAEPFCTELEPICGDEVRDLCPRLVEGLSDLGRQELRECVGMGCTGVAGLTACAEQIFRP